MLKNICASAKGRVSKGLENSCIKSDRLQVGIYLMVFFIDAKQIISFSNLLVKQV